MKLSNRIARLTLIAVLASAASLSQAQDSKKALVQKALELQQAGIEGVGVGLANQTANQVLQLAGQALGRVPEAKREALGVELQAEVRKFFEDISPMLRAGAVRLAPSTLGTAMEQNFSEDELKVLVAWFESPVSRKYQQMAVETQQALGQKLVVETRPQIEPKLKALEQVLGAKLAAATGSPAPAAAAAPGPRAAQPTAPKASAPAKK